MLSVVVSALAVTAVVAAVAVSAVAVAASVVTAVAVPSVAVLGLRGGKGVGQRQNSQHGEHDNELDTKI